MFQRIDWISFSVPIVPNGSDDERKTAAAAAAAIRELSPVAARLLALADGHWQPRNGRAPYRASFHNEERGATVFVHPRLTHALVEISGRGCEYLYSQGAELSFISEVQSRLTRLDIACDIETKARPSAFVEDADMKRFKSTSHVVSPSGETVYLGARSSDRYCRVYRYNAPHERAHLLRCEFVIKAENAKLTAQRLRETGYKATCAALGEAFGFQHETWQPGSNPADLRTYRAERREGKTLYWLASTVAPLLVRLHNEGVIDAADWYDDNIAQRLR